MGTIYKSGIPYSGGGGGGGDYTAGNGIDITGNEIAVDDTVVATKADLADKQDTLTAGDNITIENNTISADDEVFVAVYEQTSYADVKAAIDAHKAIVLDMPANNNQFCMTFATYTNGGNALMYAIYKMSDTPTLMTVTLTPQSQWTITHTDLQDKLVSGTSIKTINNISLLGSGNIDIQGGGIDFEVGVEKPYGTYKDGNTTYPVYSKVIYISALPSASGITNYPHGVTNIKQVLSMYGICTNGMVMNTPRQTTSDNIGIYQVQKSGGNFAIEVGKDRSSIGAYVTMIYAKNN